MDVTTRPWGDVLLEQSQNALRELLRQNNVLLGEMMREDVKRRRTDAEYLASLSLWRRRAVLARRKLVRRRWAAKWWLEEYVTFRFAKRRPDDA